MSTHRMAKPASGIRSERPIVMSQAPEAANDLMRSNEGRNDPRSTLISRAVLADRIIQALLVGMVLYLLAEAIAKGFA